MSNLGHLQNQLLAAIFAPNASEQFDPQGLSIYRANLRATASGALSITFPTLLQLLGEQAFAMVSEKLLQYSPPQHGDWAVWGDSLPELLSGIPELAEFPFLADCARLDYYCHQMVRRPFVSTDFESLMLMQEHPPEALFLGLNPTLILMQSEFPIAEIRQAHQQSGASVDALEDVIQAQLHPHYLACYLNNTQVQVRSLTAVEFAWLNALQSKSLGDALTEFHDTELSFETWLTEAVQTNLLNEVRFQSPTEE